MLLPETVLETYTYGVKGDPLRLKTPMTPPPPLLLHPHRPPVHPTPAPLLGTDEAILPTLVGYIHIYFTTASLSYDSGRDYATVIINTLKVCIFVCVSFIIVTHRRLVEKIQKGEAIF